MNNNVFKDGHYSSWNNTLGNNFNDNSTFHKVAMRNKNIETGGAYQADVSGAYGEFTVSSIFKALSDEYAIIDNVLLQIGTQLRPYNPEIYGESPWKIINKRGKLYEVVKKSTQVDHIIVSPYGIFVIETKNHKGWIYGDINSKVWTQVLQGMNNSRAYGGHDHYTFHNPIKQNQSHIKALSQQLRISEQYMLGMIVFTNPEAYLGNINSNCCFTVDTLYIGITSFTNKIWNQKQVLKIIDEIEKLNTSRYLASREHTMYVQDIKNRQDINKRMRGQHIFVH